MRLDVWGDPIAHSRSPQIHRAAYEVLGLDWQYGRRQVTQAQFASELGGLDAAWRGLSLTMPLKEEAFAAAVTRDRYASLTRGVNTLLLTGDGPHGFNTDVPGLVAALGAPVQSARILGAGATAASALIAVAELGTRDVAVLARRPGAAEGLRPLADELGVDLSAHPLEHAGDSIRPADVTVSTLPGNVILPGVTLQALVASGGRLMDAVYGQAAPLAEAWRGAGLPVTDGREMLLRQAVLQVRIFVNGDPTKALPDEPAVLAAMRVALMED